ncbi:RNA guanine-7 methyltransferase [Calliopsis andreniformis]|uniref:RNA guanine-7 methyltransferase n=1 Tax=Calliopsis andreniformis TaxID=337506 RepID=UPI003FCC5CCA
MSAPSLEETKEAKEEQGTPTVSEQDTAKKSSDLSSQSSSSKREHDHETNDKNYTQAKKRRKHSPGPELHKTPKSDPEQNLNNTPSDLSTGSSREKEPSKIEESSNNTVLVAEHYNLIPEKDLSARNQSRILYMRNFNNWIKSMLICEYIDKVKHGKVHGSSLRVLDMCCGKGGDLLKWKRKNVTHVVCADLAEVSVEQCQQRYNDMLNRSSNDRGFAPIFTAEFITADCTRVRLREKYKDPSIQFDFVNCQFAFHYSFESLQQAECMMRNASECLRPGGYFIGTIPDANDLVSRWQKCDGNKFGNDVYSIEFFCDKKQPPLFGAKYNFHLEEVVDCPEFLVHLPILRKLGSKYGLELVVFERFDDYYERMKNEGRVLLGKMQALETYPPYHDTPLLGNPSQDYQHAVQYMQNLPGHRKVGTLSRPEWEVISLYAVFAFQKSKVARSSEGKPENVKS